MRARNILLALVAGLVFGSLAHADDTQQKISVLNWARWDNDNERMRNSQIRLWCGSPADAVGTAFNPWPAEVGDWWGTMQTCEPIDDTDGLQPGQISDYYALDRDGAACRLSRL